MVPREQYEELRANLDSLNANVGSARAAVNSATETIKVDAAAVESAKVELSYCLHSLADRRPRRASGWWTSETWSIPADGSGNNSSSGDNSGQQRACW